MIFSTTLHGGGSEGGSGTKVLYMGEEYDDLSQTEMLEEKISEPITKKSCKKSGSRSKQQSFGTPKGIHV